MTRHPLRTRHRGLAALLLVAATACTRNEGPPAPALPPDVIVISADALRPDHLSLNGYPRETSPAIDAFAARAWHFSDAVTVIPKTGPSFATLFSGRPPAEHGLRDNLATLPESLPWLARILHENGYQTVAFVSNPALHGQWGYSRGFDSYRLFQKEDGMQQVNRAFFEWAERDWKRPAFVWIHYIDPHGPYTPPAEFADLFEGDALDGSDARAALEYAYEERYGKNKVLGAIPLYQQRDGEDRIAFYVRQYDAEIRVVDAAFAEVIAFLEETGRFDESAIFFLSDHGESMGEHDYYFEHGWYAYDATLRVPLLFKPPGETRGRRVTGQVSHLDFFPTVLETTGVENRWPGSGRSLLAEGERDGDVPVQNSARYAERFAGVRGRGQKYLRDLDTGDEELYDLESDPDELRNLVPDDPEALRDARRRFEAVHVAPVPMPGTMPALPPDDVDALRRLGYAE